MKAPEIPANEKERLAALSRLCILDTDSEARFDRLTALAQFAFRVEIALVSLVDQKRQWFKSAQGLAVRETSRDISFCGHAINEAEPFIIPDALLDDRFVGNPLVTEAPHIRFYAGAQLRDREGFVLGTFCLIDSKPRVMSAGEQAHLRYLADLVERELLYNDWHQAFDEQLAAQQQLKVRENLLRTIIDNLPVNIYVKDLDHRKILANRSEQRFVGATSEAELIGLKDEDIYPAHGDMLTIGEQEDQRVTRQGKAIINKENYGIRHDGALTQFLVSKIPLFDDNNAITGLVGISVDITKEKEATEQAERQLLALRLLQEISSELGTSMDERMRRALRIGLDYLAMDIGIISQIENDIYGLQWLQANVGIEFHEGQTLKLEDTYCQLLFENDGELVIEHMGQSRYAHHRVYQMHQLESYLGVLLTLEGRVIGTLNFTSKRPRSRPLSDGERLFMRLLGRWVTANLERRRSQEKLKDLVSHVPGMIYQFRLWPNGRRALLYCSPGIADLFDLSMASAMEDIERIIERIHEEDLSAFNFSIAKSAQSLTVWESQFRILDGRNQYRWVEGHATPKRTLDGGTIWHGYIHDIDERKKVERVKSEFVSTVSHELRTPLTSIGGSLRLIAGGAMGELPKQVQRLIDVAQKNTDHLTLLINDLLDLEKLNTAEIRLSFQPESVAELLAHAIETNTAYAQRSDVALTLEENSHPHQLMVDASRFQQIMTNLISNAVKFSTAGKSVAVGWRLKNNQIEIHVKDEGCGIPANFQDRAFERFTQADSSDRRTRGGTGLGLAITRELTELMKGKIWFESEEGIGTTFYLEFPLYSPPHGAIESPLSEQE